MAKKQATTKKKATKAKTKTVDEQTLPGPQPHLPNGMNIDQFNLTINDLTLKQMNATLGLTLAQIQHNQVSIAAMRNQAYVSVLSELRMLVNTYQIDIEKTIMQSEPKYKPLFDGVHQETLQDTIMKIVMKLKTDLEIK